MKCTIVTLIVVLMSGGWVVHADQTEAKTFDLLRDLLVIYQSGLGKDIQVTGRYEDFEAKDGVLPKQCSSYYNFVTETKLGDGSWIRMVCAPYAAAVLDKPGQYAIRDMQFIFDYNKWYTLTSAIHQEGHIFNIQQCNIAKEEPIWIGGDKFETFGTGRAALLPDLKIFGDRTIEELVTNPTLPEHYSVATRKESGATIFVISDKCQAVELYFFPSDIKGVTQQLGKMLLKMNLCALKPRKFEIEYSFTSATAEEEVQSGVPYFKQIKRTMRLADVVQNVSNIVIDNVKLGVANAHAEIELAPGWVVHDEILGAEYKTDQDKNEMLQSLRKILTK